MNRRMGSQRTKRQHWRRVQRTNTGALIFVFVCIFSVSSLACYIFCVFPINLHNISCGFLYYQKRRNWNLSRSASWGHLCPLLSSDQCMSQCRLWDLCVYTGLDYSPLLLSCSNILPLAQPCASLGGSSHLSCPTGPFFHCLYLMTLHWQHLGECCHFFSSSPTRQSSLMMMKIAAGCRHLRVSVVAFLSVL